MPCCVHVREAVVADDLREILDIAKREMDDVPPETWARLERIIRLNFGAHRAYIASQKKGRHLAALEAAGNQDVDRVASMLGVSVRRVQQLKRLK